MKRVYLDYNATTPVDPRVADAMLPFLREDFGKKFPPKVVEGNIAAITRSYEEVQSE